MSGKLKFGTDGWRGVIGDDFSFHNIAAIVESLHCHLQSDLKLTSGHVVIGFDCRFLARDAAEVAATLLHDKGHQVTVASDPLPSPAISWATNREKASIGMMITASHNPHLYNGVKFKGNYGGSYTPERVSQLAQHVPANFTADCIALLRERDRLFVDLPAGVSRIDLRDAYGEALLKQIGSADFSSLNIVVDPMHGASAGILAKLLKKCGAEVTEVRGNEDPYFGGVHPEPLEATTAILRQTVTAEKAVAGFALDGDGDRIGACDENGHFVDSHQIFSLLLSFLVDEMGQRGRVIKTISATNMIDKLGEQFGLDVKTVPVGFKYICDEMLKGGVLIGGEESGGIGIASYLPERDGTLCALLLTQMLASSQHRSLEKLIGQLFERVGQHAYFRIDQKTAVGQATEILAKFKSGPPAKLDKWEILDVDQLDGIKLIAKDAWLLFRASGTEPLLRVYAEAATREDAEALVWAGVDELRRRFGEAIH